MKITGRNIKRRLYDLRYRPSDLKRARYWRGHGVHSPFVYDIVRQVFMCRELKYSDNALFEALSALDIPRKRCIQLQNLFHHCRYTRYGIDCKAEAFAGLDMVIITTDIEAEELALLAEAARLNAVTLCIIAPALDKARRKACEEIVSAHRCTSIDNRGYLLLLNNHLPKQAFRL